MLNHPAIFPSRLNAATPLVHLMAQRLFDVHVFARLARPNREERMPMIRRGDGNHIEIFIVEGLANVLKTFRRVAALVPNLLAPRLEQAAVGIDEMSDLNVFELQILIDMRAALAVNTSHADT